MKIKPKIEENKVREIIFLFLCIDLKFSKYINKEKNIKPIQTKVRYEYVSPIEGNKKYKSYIIIMKKAKYLSM